MIFFEWSIKVTYCKKSSMWMHPHLDVHTTNWYGLQVGIVIKRYVIYTYTFTCPKHLHIIVSVFDKYLHYSCVNVKCLGM
jgi:hypothetical protein